MVSVKEFMTRNPVTVRPDDMVTHARSVIRKHGFRALPVVEGQRLVGIISRGDIMLVTSTKTNLMVGGIMNPNVYTVTTDASISDSAKLIIKSGVRQLPVVEGQRLVGIISSVDILKALVGNYEPKKNKVSDVMTESVLSCSPSDDLSGIWNRMLVRGFAGMPVVEKGVVHGMVTRMDVLRHISAQLSRESGKPRAIKVRKVMTVPAITVKPVDKIGKAAGLLLDKKIIRLPVVDDKNRLLGILDITDVIKAYLA
ncbi:MAG: CBS domain-containing protein [Candidatus Altiarchaeota archaeon]|nr:CBS domain-containing protein [Candidatus Altiarchaeota archaeon]